VAGRTGLLLHDINLPIHFSTLNAPHIDNLVPGMKYVGAIRYGWGRGSS